LRLEKQAEGGSEVSAFVNLLIDVRTELRVRKLWDMTDLIRERLLALGVVLEDSKEGTTWHWK